MEISHQKWSEVNNAIKNIHTTKINELYPLFLELVASLIYFDKASFEIGERKKDEIIYTDAYSINMENRFIEPQTSGFHVYDTMYWFLFGCEPDVFRESDYSTPFTNQQSKYYELWMKPQNIKYCLGARIVLNDVFYGTANFYRSPESLDFSEEDVFVLRILNEHISLRLNKIYPKGIPRSSSSESFILSYSKYNLTQQELRVLKLTIKGYTNNNIAKELFISENTAKKHLSNIYSKVNVNSRYGLIKIALDEILNSSEGIDSF